MTDTATTVTVTIPMEPVSALMPNQLEKNNHWRKRADARRECRQMARYAAMASGMYLEPFTGPVHLTLTAFYGYRRVKPDLDATISACKPFIDGIVDAGILVDDKQIEKITATHYKIKSKRGEKPQGYTRIQIEVMG